MIYNCSFALDADCLFSSDLSRFIMRFYLTHLFTNLGLNFGFVVIRNVVDIKFVTIVSISVRNSVDQRRN